MIAAVRNKLAEVGKAGCENASLFGQEKGRGVKLTPSRGKAIKINIDGCLIRENTKKCDCLYFYHHSKNKHYAFLVELKGNNYPEALQQLAATKRHQSYLELFEFAKPCKELAVAIVAEKARTNRPRQDEWEDTNNLRLKVIPLERDKTYDLYCLVG